MIVYLNGEFLQEENAVVPIADRGLLYGDGLFETLRIFQGHPFRCEQHWQRLKHGAQELGLPLPLDGDSFRKIATDLIQHNRMPDAMFRFTVTAGSGPRGYTRPASIRPTLLATLGTVPPGDWMSPSPWQVIVARHLKASRQPLSAYKTCSRLLNVLARTEASAANANEALLLNESGDVAEGAASNVFCWMKDRLQTPPLPSGALPGITRAVVFELAKNLGIELEEKPLTVAALHQSDGVFLSLSSYGLVEVGSLDHLALARSGKTTEMQKAYATLVQKEIGTLHLA